MSCCRLRSWLAPRRIIRSALVCSIVAAAVAMPAWLPSRAAAAEPIPHAQDKPPGPPLSPEEAIAKMTVPEGFSVEVVASEPDLVNPVAMTFDERGRIWVTESLEYPRHEPGPGQDRVKVLEDTDHDGRVDRVTIFADGLNIPSGIAVGAGGVWVANAPDLLFLQDTDGDGRADRREVVVTGFGRNDTHELPNSLTWGPDGWLYGLNGVFNPAHIHHQGHDHDFTCALFRVHPQTRAFELFAEGTSNPWGVAWDGEGSAFLSACVIDHLWHLTETGYYLRQGGPYPPFTSVIGSIVNHHHQKAAYCGIHYFDSDAYPPEYRGRLYMGNIHGGCLNVDRLERDGSTYRGIECPDFLTANDAWFMPVVQKTGPDGCLYVLDWYDRYHCYQDAGRDPKGIDRLKGRLYRIRYQNTPRAAPFDLAKESDEQLMARLSSPNVFYRDLAQRLLWERNHAETRPRLEAIVLDEAAPRPARMHALWALVATGALDVSFHRRLLSHADSVLRAWGVRAAGNFRQVLPEIAGAVLGLATDSAPDVRLQVAISAAKLNGVDPAPVLLQVLAASDGDKLIPHIVWQNLHPIVENRPAAILDPLAKADWSRSAALRAMVPRIVERLVARRDRNPAPLVQLVELVVSRSDVDPSITGQTFDRLAKEIETHEIAGDRLAAVRTSLTPVLTKILTGPADGPLYLSAAVLATSLGDPAGSDAARKIYLATGDPAGRRRAALGALVSAGDSGLPAAVATVLGDGSQSQEMRGLTLAAIDRAEGPWVSKVVLTNYARFEPELQPKAIDLLTSRAPWAHDLLDAIGRREIPAAALNVNQVRKLLDSKDQGLVDKVRTQWGTRRTERNPQREEVIANVRRMLTERPGDAQAGQAIFNRVCGQCHKIYGQGQEVGPDLTSNGRSSLEQLLSNVLDPSLVIGSGYLARTVITTDGRVLTGLTVEDNPQHVILKIQGGKLETISREDVEEVRESKLSLMPEELEKQIQPQEMADLFSFLALDKPPADPTGRRLPGLAAPR